MPPKRNTSSVRHRQRRQIEANDPALSDLRVGSDEFCSPDGDWRRDGQGVGRNTRLERLEVSSFEDDDASSFEDDDENDPRTGVVGVSEEAVGEFFRGVAENRSIADLELDLCDFAVTIFESLVPFFENNRNFKNIEVVGLGPRGINSLAESLKNNTSLESIVIRDDFGDVDEALRTLCTMLAVHPSLTYVHFDGFQLSRVGGGALSPLLQSANSNAIELYLECNTVTDAGMAKLSRGLTNCSVVRKMTINMRQSTVSVSTVGWLSLAACLNGPSCGLEALVLRCANLNDELAIALSVALRNNTHLKSLDISSHRGMLTISGWRAFAALLRSLHTQLRELFLVNCGINNEATLALASSLNNNTSLNHLDLSFSDIDTSGLQALADLLSSPHSKLERLSLKDCGISSRVALPLANAFSNGRLKAVWLDGNDSIRPQGLQAILNAFARPDSLLEELGLGDCAITDEAVIDLATSLNTNNTLRVLSLYSNPRISITMWQVIASSLQNPQSALEELDVRNNGIKDDVAIMFANSLANNNKSKLKILNFDINREITKAAWDAFSQVLCNQTSITSTYNSNHTLEALHPYPTNYIHDLEKMNRNKNKSDVARKKIIKHHFANGTSIEPLVGMELKLLPHAASWMAKSVTDINDGGKSLLFSFVPLLLDSTMGPDTNSNACD